jgi:hypothetical protein
MAAIDRDGKRRVGDLIDVGAAAPGQEFFDSQAGGGSFQIAEQLRFGGYLAYVPALAVVVAGQRIKEKRYLPLKLVLNPVDFLRMVGNGFQVN